MKSNHLFKNKIIEIFYYENQALLEEFYAGLNLFILKRFFEDIAEEELDRTFGLIKKGTPLSYISGKHFFYEHEFIVNSNVLIPRVETEVLVHEAIQEINQGKSEQPRIIDIGTGSGCIGLSVAAGVDKSCELILSDISEKALQVAQANYNKLQFSFDEEQRTIFNKGDRFEGITEVFDYILSNPPYIKKEAHSHLVHQGTKDFEPELALYLEDESYFSWFDDFFRDIARCSHKETQVFLELHEETIADLKVKLEVYFSEVRIMKDLAQADRFLFARKKL